MKNKSILSVLLISGMILAACNEKEEVKVNEEIDTPSAEVQESTEEETDIVDNYNENTSTEHSEDLSATDSSEDSSSGNSTLDFLNDNTSSSEIFEEEAIASNPISEKTIQKEANEIIDKIIKLYAKDERFSDEDNVYNYLKENTRIPESIIKDNMAPYYQDMNDYNEYSKVSYSLISAKQTSIDGIEVTFELDVTFYDKPSNEQVEYFKENYTVLIGEFKDENEFFAISIQSRQR